jgi:hypothetical protein
VLLLLLLLLLVCRRCHAPPPAAAQRQMALAGGCRLLLQVPLLLLLLNPCLLLASLPAGRREAVCNLPLSYGLLSVFDIIAGQVACPGCSKPLGACLCLLVGLAAPAWPALGGLVRRPDRRWCVFGRVGWHTVLLVHGCPRSHQGYWRGGGGGGGRGAPARAERLSLSLTRPRPEVARLM